MEVDPKDVRFCQSTIKDCFQNRGANTGRNLLAVFIDLWDKKLDPYSMQGRMEVLNLTRAEKEAIERYQRRRNVAVNIQENQRYAVEGNRRLYIFQKLAEANKINNVPYKQLQGIGDNQRKKFTTTNRGVSIRLRPQGRNGNPVQKRIEDIVARGYVTEEDRDFARQYSGNEIVGGGRFLLGGGAQMAYHESAAQGTLDDEDEVYYDSDDDGL